MRFKLTLRIDEHSFNNYIPINYAYELSAVIYRILSKSGTDYAAWLHDNGFEIDGKHFKLFTFSRLYVPQYHIEGDRMEIISDSVEWQISFLPERSTKEFIQGIFQNQTFELGTRAANARFVVEQIAALAPPLFSETMEFETLSPVCISRRRKDGGTDYLSPDAQDVAFFIRQNLLNKYKAFTEKDFSDDFNFSFEVLSKPKSSLITIKSGTSAQTRVRGFMCRFRITAPVELMTILYESGVGEKGSVGFGMCRLLS